MTGSRSLIASARGFTYVETLVVVLLCSLILGAAHMLFSQGVRSSVKGMDLLESIRAANEVFSNIRKDLRGSVQVNAASPKITIPTGAAVFPDLTSAMSDTLIFVQPVATVTYRLLSGAGGHYIEREENTGGAVSKRNFAVPRIKSFEAAKIGQMQRVAAGYDVFVQDQLLVRISVESSDPRFPGGKVDLSSFFVTGQLMQTAWWNYFYDFL
ncbi:MAG: hypothetical protein BWY66_01823 [bacterium ADurb.Bin374]|nr:MAG: hypothetical protein BWY66_01823 [bacterium ADurb.Bin374]